MSPTQRTLKALRENGFLAAVVEHWNPHAKVRQDMFGFVDVLAVHGNENDGRDYLHGATLAVQATSDNGGNMAKRVAKVKASAYLPTLLAAGWWVEVWGWRKKGARWIVRKVRVLNGGDDDAQG